MNAQAVRDLRAGYQNGVGSVGGAEEKMQQFVSQVEKRCSSLFHELRKNAAVCFTS